MKIVKGIIKLNRFLLVGQVVLKLITVRHTLRSFVRSSTFKHTTQSYSYSNSSGDESERIERKEKKRYERYERKLIREHLRQKSEDQSYEYCLESFEYAGRNLADTNETDGGITVSVWSEPEPSEDNEEDEIFV